MAVCALTVEFGMVWLLSRIVPLLILKSLSTTVLQSKYQNTKICFRNRQFKLEIEILHGLRLSHPPMAALQRCSLDHKTSRKISLLTKKSNIQAVWPTVLLWPRYGKGRLTNMLFSVLLYTPKCHRTRLKGTHTSEWKNEGRFLPPKIRG